MKLKHHYLPVILLLLLVASACQKDNKFPDEPPTGTTAQKVQHKWKIRSIETNAHFAGIDNQTKYDGTSEEYIDFRSDGQMYTYFRNRYDTTTYEVVSDKYIAIGGDQATIRELTDQTLVLFSRDNSDAFGYFELTYNLYK